MKWTLNLALFAAILMMGASALAAAGGTGLGPCGKNHFILSEPCEPVASAPGEFYAGSTVTLPDGHVLSSGGMRTGDNGYGFAVSRTDAQGAPDPSFNGSGFSVVPIWGYYEFAGELLVQPDGKIVVSGGAADPAFAWNDQCYPAFCQFYPALTRFNSDGTPDQSFNAFAGKIVLSVGDEDTNAEPGDRGEITRIEMDAAGGILVFADQTDRAVARLNADGTLDAAYVGAAGRVREVVLHGPGSVQAQGLWWKAPTQPGWEGLLDPGWAIHFSHQGDSIFATWVTYDSKDLPIWLSAFLRRTDGDLYTGSVYRTAAPSRLEDPVASQSLPYAPGSIQASVAGEATLAFRGDVTATFAYSVDGLGAVTAIMRRDFGAPEECVWGGSVDPAAATSYTDLWWNPGEPGWAFSLDHHGDSIFAIWLTYGLDGQSRWLIAHLEKTAERTFAGSIETLPQPGRRRYLYEPAGTVTGSASIHFANGNDATFDYAVSGAFWNSNVGSRPITRQVFTAATTLCH